MRVPLPLAFASWIVVPALCGAIPAMAQQSSGPTTSAADTAHRLGAVVIVASPSGRGETRGANAIGRRELHERAAGTSALKAVEKLPGVNVQSSDPWGSYEWANRVTIRGLQTQQIGQTFDGLPLGDMSYGNFNGLGIGRAIDAENLASGCTACSTRGEWANGRSLSAPSGSMGSHWRSAPTMACRSQTPACTD